MKGIIITALGLLAAGHVIQPAQAQTAPRVQVAGTVGSVDAGANQLVLKTDNGDSIAVTTTEKTSILHLAAGVTDPTKATKMAIGEVQV